MKRIIVFLILMLLTLVIVSCAENVDAIPKKDNSTEENSADKKSPEQSKEQEISFWYDEFMYNIIELSDSPWSPNYEMIDSKKDSDEFIARYRAFIDADCEAWKDNPEGIELLRAYEEDANKIFERLDEAFFEENVLLLVALNVWPDSPLEDVRVYAADDALKIDLVVPMEISMGIENEYAVTVATAVDRDTVMQYGDNILVAKTRK